MRSNLLPILLAALILAGGANYALAAEAEPLPDAQMLVSPANPLPSAWEPQDLTPVSSFVRANGDVLLRADAAQALRDMLAALKAAGIKDIYVSSGYRNFVRQDELHTAKVDYYRRQGANAETASALAARWVLPPGQSEHQTGLALDFSTASLHYDLVDGFAQTPAGNWLAEHSAEYGFIVRYTQDKEVTTGVAPEPWHFRYVGADHAFYMQQHGLCLEEYQTLLAKQSPLKFLNAQGEERAVYYTKDDTGASLPGQLLSVSLACQGSGDYIITVIPPLDPLFDTIGHWGEPFIRRLYALGAVNGYADGSFRPDAGVSRGEFVTALSRLPLPIFTAVAASTELLQEPAQTEEPGTGPDLTLAEAQQHTEQTAQEEAPLGGPVVLPYTDVEPGQYYYQPLLLCYTASLVQPLTAESEDAPLFEASRLLSRGEAALMLAQALRTENFILPPSPSFRDVPPPAGPLYRAVELLAARGVISGDNEGLYHAERNVSRAEMSALLCRLLDIAVQEQAAPDAAHESMEGSVAAEATGATPVMATDN